MFSKVASAKRPDQIPRKFPQDFSYQGLQFSLNPYVFSPKRHSSSLFLAKSLREENPAGILTEIGTGSGIVGLSTLALCGLDYLWATDVNPYAVECTRGNSQRLMLGGKTSVHKGDVFDPLPINAKADVIFWNTPWMRMTPSQVIQHGDNAPRLTRIQLSFCDPDYRALRKYIRGADQRLLPNGRIFLGFGKGGHMDELKAIAKQSGYEVIERKTFRKENCCLVGLYELARPTGKTCLELRLLP